MQRGYIECRSAGETFQPNGQDPIVKSCEALMLTFWFLTKLFIAQTTMASLTIFQIQNWGRLKYFSLKEARMVFNTGLQVSTMI